MGKIAFHISEGVVFKRDIPQINNLLKQLNPNVLEVTFESMIAVRKSSILLIARDMAYASRPFALESQGCRILGMLTLTHAVKPTAHYGMIEDVIVDEEFRKMGIARKLIQRAVHRATDLGFAYIDLSSNPQRTEAHALYKSEGFTPRNSDYFRKNITWK